MHPTGARNTYKANEFAETAKSYGMLTPAQAKRLTVVPVDLEDAGTIVAAIGNAGRVSLDEGCCTAAALFAPLVQTCRQQEECNA